MWLPKARIEARITRLKGGNLSGSKPVGEGKHELVIDFGPGYRIYFAPHGNELIVLLCAGSKKAAAVGHNIGKRVLGKLQIAILETKGQS